MTIIQEEIMDKIIKDYDNGNSPDKLSKTYSDYFPYIIRENLKRCGVFRSSYFTEEELQNIKRDFSNNMSIREISKRYNRREDVLRKKLKELGLYVPRKYDIYTDEEIQILKEYYPSWDWDTLLKLLPNKNKSSIINKACKLGIKQGLDTQILNKLSQSGLKLLEDFKTVRVKHKLTDRDGYLYYIQLDGILYTNDKPRPFSPKNPYTIDNIKNYIKINNIDCELLSNKYVNSTQNLQWKCSCGKIFNCSWVKFSGGKHQCNDCSKLKCESIYSIEQVKNMIKDKSYKMIESSFTSFSNGFTAITNDGYYVVIDKGNIIKGNEPEIFHKHNPYTIQNINHYLELNNIKTKLLSTEYNNNTTPLQWKCQCGEVFSRNWRSFYHGEGECIYCIRKRKGAKERIDIDEIKNTVSEMGLNIVDDISEKAITSSKFSLIDKDGYLYYTHWSSIKNKKYPEKFLSSNIYSIQNINNLMRLERNGEYHCISKKYINNTHKLTFQHKCGCIFKASLLEMQGKLSLNGKDKYYKQCPKCSTNKTESNHASILKQIFLHNFPDTSIEDKSCINPKTQRTLPTDIVNHKMKIAIEIQSGYHDKPEQKKVDEFKKNFWINKGYSFFDPDIRDYSILEMIQIFFPDIQEIPEYIDYNFSNCIDFTKIQKLLNEGYVISEISEKLNIKKWTIQSFINNKKVFLPEGYKEKVFNIKSVIQLTKSGEYINKFNSLSDMDKHGYKMGTVNRVLKGIQKFAYNCYWVFEKDYLSGNFKIPTEDFDKYTVGVDKYDMNDNYIKTYSTIYEAENDSASNKSEIYRVASGNRKSSRNEKWKFTKTA
jgi:hypothetical protein